MAVYVTKGVRPATDLIMSALDIKNPHAVHNLVQLMGAVNNTAVAAKKLIDAVLSTHKTCPVERDPTTAMTRLRQFDPAIDVEVMPVVTMTLSPSGEYSLMDSVATQTRTQDSFMTPEPPNLMLLGFDRMSDGMVATRQLIYCRLHSFIMLACNRQLEMNFNADFSATGFITIIEKIPYDGIIDLLKLLDTERCSDSDARAWDTTSPSATLPSVERRDVGTNTCELLQMAFDADTDNSDGKDRDHPGWADDVETFRLDSSSGHTSQSSCNADSLNASDDDVWKTIAALQQSYRSLGSEPHSEWQELNKDPVNAAVATLTPPQPAITPAEQ